MHAPCMHRACTVPHNVRTPCTQHNVLTPGPAPGVVREGWLHKRGNNRIWAKRYFVLTKHALCYYNKPPTR